MESPGNADRLTRVETLLGVVIDNQESSKERQHKLANEVMLISSKQVIVESKIDDALQLEARVIVLEGTRSFMITGWQIFKWMTAVSAACFTFALAVGEKLAKIVSMLWGH